MLLMILPYSQEENVEGHTVGLLLVDPLVISLMASTFLILSVEFMSLILISPSLILCCLVKYMTYIC